MTYPGSPNNYDFGTEFNYELWTPGTVIDMVNVPWNNDYRDVVKFDSPADLDAYIDSLAPVSHRLSEMTYIKPNSSIKIGLPFNVANGFNYVRVTNPVQPIAGDVAKKFYYFITDVKYVNPGNTELTTQLDLFQTYGYQVEFGNCYVERGHIGIANERAFENRGRDYLTVPEGLDVGSNYVVVTKRDRKIMVSNGVGGDPFAWVLAISTVNLQASGGTVDNPDLVSAEGSRPHGIVSGASFFIWRNQAAFLEFLQKNQNTPWVVQGIISITLIPPLTRYNPLFDTIDIGWVPMPLRPYRTNDLRHDLFPNWRMSTDVDNYIPARYRHLLKLRTAPYMWAELTSWSGTPVNLRPEVWANDDGTVIERISIVPPNQRIEFHPFKYNAANNSPTERLIAGGTVSNPNTLEPGEIGGDDYGDYLNVGTQIGNLPSVPIVSNGGIAYLAANAHSLAFGKESADWSQQRAMAGNQAAYDNASTGIDANKIASLLSQGQMQGLNAQANNALANGGALLGMASSGLGMAGAGSTAGMAGAGAGGLLGLLGQSVQQNQMNANNAINVNASNSQMENQNRASGDIRDTNKSLADWAAKGDYQNTIAGINAKIQDASLIPPSIVGQLGGDIMNLIHNNTRVVLRIKMIDQSAIRTVGEYWLRYGYAVHKFLKPPVTLRTMSKFTYWKMTETYIKAGPMPEAFKQAIRGIFEKGVTVWVDPNDIGNIDIAENTPLGGISY
jgi:hypothetical protein